jgi:hypothetical protein
MGLKLAQALGSADNDLAARQSAFDAFGSEWAQYYQEFAAARSELIAAARSLLVSIMGVDKRPAE